MKALRALLHLQNHYCQQKSIADLEVVTSIHLFIFRHFAIQLREERSYCCVFPFNKFSFNKSFNKHIKVSWRCYIIPLLFIMNPSSPSVNTLEQLSSPVIPGSGEWWRNEGCQIRPFKRIFNDVKKFLVKVKIQVSERGMEAGPTHVCLDQV